MTTDNVIDMSQFRTTLIEPQSGMHPLVKLALILIILAVSLHIFEILLQGFRCMKLIGMWC